MSAEGITASPFCFGSGKTVNGEDVADTGRTIDVLFFNGTDASSKILIIISYVLLIQ